MSEPQNNTGHDEVSLPAVVPADVSAPAAGGAPAPLAGGSPSPAAAAAASGEIRGSWPRRLLAAMSAHPLIRRAVFVVLLCALAIPVYRPGLNRYFVADQAVYFAELRGDRSFAAGMHFWDYSRSRQLNRGDEVLFRPLLFTLLAAENTFFGLDHVAWNITNLVLHLLTIYMLFELLMRLAPWPFAELGALFAAVAYTGLELVLWNHLGGYLLGYAFLLLALLAARKVGMEGPAAYRRWLPVYALAILLSMGFYELAVGVSLLAPLYFWWCLRRRPGAGAPRLPWLAASLLPVLLYAAIYTWRALQAHHLFLGVDAVVAPQYRVFKAPPSALARCGELLWGWVLRAADPWRNQLAMSFGLRMEFAQPVHTWSWADSAVYGAAAALLAWTLWSPASRRRLRREAPFLILVVLTILGYAGMNGLGRVYTTPVCYYLYLFALLGVILFFTAVDLARLNKSLQWAAAAGLLALIGINAAHSHRTSDLIGMENADAVAYFQAIERFVAGHRDEPDFSFAVQDRPVFLDRSVSVWYGYPNHHTVKREFPLSELLFTRYYDHLNPKYRRPFPASAEARGLSTVEAEAAWFRRAAAGGDVEAMISLGGMYENGWGLPRDEAEAVKCFRKAAEAGSVKGMTNLGVMYEEGFGVAKNYAQALQWYRAAAEGGDAGGMYNLGAMYAAGHGVPKDEAAAVKWYRRAAEGGDASAMNNLGAMYAEGWGAPKDEAEAVKWWRAAAEGGDAGGMYNLGVMYAAGRGVDKDEDEALKWFRKSAALGNEDAIQILRRLEPGPAPER